MKNLLCFIKAATTTGHSEIALLYHVSNQPANMALSVVDLQMAMDKPYGTGTLSHTLWYKRQDTVVTNMYQL